LLGDLLPQQRSVISLPDSLGGREQDLHLGQHQGTDLHGAFLPVSGEEVEGGRPVFLLDVGQDPRSQGHRFGEICLRAAVQNSDGPVNDHQRGLACFPVEPAVQDDMMG